MDQDTPTRPVAPAYSPVLDPYAPPSVDVSAPVYEQGPEAPLAGRGSRLGAQILNGLMMMPGFGLGGGAVAMQELKGEGEMSVTQIILGLAAFLYLLAILIINLKLLAKEGQSLGKKWMKIRIVRDDGNPATLGRLIGMRYAITAIISAIPFVGGFYSLANYLFIFRENRKCLHDSIADTKVVVA